MKNWELCPKCNGPGRQSPTGLSDCTSEICSLCNGTMIISAFTGKPPVHTVTLHNFAVTDSGELIKIH